VGKHDARHINEAIDSAETTSISAGKNIEFREWFARNLQDLVAQLMKLNGGSQPRRDQATH
jgi:hypothetical protein